MAATRLFVGNLSNNVNVNDLKTAFSNFGEITALDIKTKPSSDTENKQFAFVTLSASNYDIETCIKHFTNKDFNGSRLYVARARESFLERLQREREQALKKEIEKNEPVNTNFNPKPLNINLKPHKRHYDTNNVSTENGYDKKPKKKFEKGYNSNPLESTTSDSYQNKRFSKDAMTNNEKDHSKLSSDMKRLESMKKKRQEFNQKKLIIKTGLIDVDKAPNKKFIFADFDEEVPSQNGLRIDDAEYNYVDNNRKNKLFDDGDDSDNEVNFEIKKQFEGKKGQKVLDLQSRYKADKRFVLDERFIEDDKSDEEVNQGENNDENVELGHIDEKHKQLNILQDVLGVPIKVKQPQDNKQTKSKLGMLRFDPSQPEHAKFLAPVITNKELLKKSKKKKSKENPEEEFVQEHKEVEKVEVSKEQFYKVSETLKETMEQPNTFSLRSLFGNVEVHENGDTEMAKYDDENVRVPINKEKKVKNPLDPGEKNPFTYDSSDSEEEETTVNKETVTQLSEQKPVWREKLFFSQSDDRLKEGLLFFTQINVDTAHKHRRELKSVMKKRIYNKERKNQMFQKKIGGRRKVPKKNFRKKSYS